MATSVNVHNVDRNVLCDWIEASVVFDAEQLSKSDVVTALIQQQVYQKQDFAGEIVDQAWSVISDRVKYLGQPLGLKVSGNRIERTAKWDLFPAYGFCLALSCAPLYPKWVKHWGAASERGELFEELAQESFSKALSGWTVRRIGWSPKNPTKLWSDIDAITSALNEVAASERHLHVNKHANELGLDLLVYYSYGDVQASIPIVLVQCASGGDWLNKRHTPDLEIWDKVISFNSRPIRGFAMPFAYADPTDFRRDTLAVKGVFVDRNRLLGAFHRTSSMVSNELNAKLTKWVRQVVASIPRDK